MHTAKQQKATERNWLIRRLRSAAALFKQLGNAKGVDAVNVELRKLKARIE